MDRTRETHTNSDCGTPCLSSVECLPLTFECILKITQPCILYGITNFQKPVTVK
jgi:hypothetical protein